MWLKLIQRNADISKMIKPQFVNNTWRKPVISGSKKAQLKRYFHQAGAPWIYEKPDPEIHFASTYNRRPKGSRREINYESKLALVRKNLSTMDKKLEDQREEQLYKRKMGELDTDLYRLVKALNFAEQGGKKASMASKASSQAQKDLNKSIGVESKKPTSKKSRGASKGGNVNKRLRASFELTGASINDMDAGKGYSTQAARDMQVKEKEKQPKQRKPTKEEE
uniref:MRPL25 domain-containing protein n=1 Tax=Strombidium rassoulzadegani TaxID=1082188 RepID=A0A7S3FSX3_9SPIT|mmetsp:Transcript_12753/g.21515  ORF Transcript_12753/g.21515 Transcript_12753/m.21515 type:complete len:223 (+) Transcript_12753:21-689(+)